MREAGEMGSQVRVQHRAFWMPKGGHREDEYEDAFAVQQEPSLPFCAAVADGATETAFARAWAGRLAEGFVTDCLGDAAALAVRLPQWQAAWASDVRSRSAALPWYAAAKAREGAFAALLGLVLRQDATWHALAIGDACLFHLRSRHLVGRPWPVETAEAFGNHPTLVSSLPGAASPTQERSGTWRQGDVFLMATDALAAWLIERDPASALQLTPSTFAEAVRHARTARQMRNDDVTLVVLQIG